MWPRPAIDLTYHTPEPPKGKRNQNSAQEGFNRLTSASTRASQCDRLGTNLPWGGGVAFCYFFRASLAQTPFQVGDWSGGTVTTQVLAKLF